MRDRQKTPPTQVHRTEATLKSLVILLQYREIFYKIHKSIKAKKYVAKSIHICVFSFEYAFSYFFPHSTYNSMFQGANLLTDRCWQESSLHFVIQNMKEV